MRVLVAAALATLLVACEREDEDPPTPQGPDLGALIRTANEEMLNKGNAAFARQNFADAYVLHAGGEEMRGGPELLEGFVTQMRTAFPDLTVSVEILATSGDRVTWMRTNRGTHRAEYMGVPPSNREVVWHDLAVSRFEGTRVAEEWGVSDLGEKLRTP